MNKEKLEKKVKKRGKILYSLLFLLITIGLIPLIFSDWKLIQINRDVLETKEKLLQQNISASIAQMISLFLESQKNEMRNIALSLEVYFASPGGFSSIPPSTRQTILENYLNRYPDLRKLILLNTRQKGSQMGYSYSGTAVDNYLQESYSRGLQGEEYLSDTYFVNLENLQETVVVFSLPIKREATEDVLGVVSAVISLAPIQEYIKERFKDSVYTVYCIDSGGNLLAHSEIIQLIQRADLSQVAIVEEFFRVHSRASITQPFTLQTEEGNVEMLGTSSPISNLRWAVFVQVEEKIAYRSVHTMIQQTAIWGSITCLIALVIAVLFARRMSSPIQELAKGAKALAKGDFSHKISVKSNNELADLSDTFNIMTDKIHLYIEQVKRAAQENKELFLSSIKTLAAAIDEKDPYTRGHSERVTQYSLAIARHMHLPAEQIETIQIAALLHDVGKIGIDDAVLRKPGKLTEEEYDIIKQHPRKGANIMFPIKQLKKAIPGMLYHHELLDGSGYPEGLKAEEIPMIAKIIAVADCFDAMTSERPYQKAFEPEMAIKKLFDLINTRYDPLIVAALLEAYEKGEIDSSQVESDFKTSNDNSTIKIKRKV